MILTGLFSESNASLEDIKEFVESALLVKDLRHENILPIIGVAFPPPKGLPLVVFPLMAHGDLKSLLLKPEMVSIEIQGKMNGMICFPYVFHSHK